MQEINPAVTLRDEEVTLARGCRSKQAMDRFQCEECGQFFYFDLELEGIEAEPGQRLALACPHCEHRWSFFRPEEPDGITVFH